MSQPNPSSRTSSFLRGQASLEHMLMFSFGLLIATMFFISAYTMLSDSIVSVQAKSAADLLGKEADYTRALGPGTIRHIDVFIPSGTTNISVSGRVIYINASVSGGNIDSYEVSSGNVTGNISSNPGMKRVEMRTLDSGTVQMTEAG